MDVPHELEGFCQYDGYSNIIINTSQHYFDVESAIIHENTHNHIILKTCFGLFQKFLYSLLMEDKSLDHLSKNRVALILETTVRESKEVHEGIATFIKITYIKKNVSPEEASLQLALCTDHCKTGYDKIYTIVNALEMPSLESSILALAIAESCFNNDAFSYIPQVVEYGNSFTLIFDLIENNSPDHRLQKFYSYVSDPLQATNLRLHIKNRLKKEKIKIHVPKVGLDWDMASKITRILIQSIDEFVFPILEKGIPKSKLDQLNKNVQIFNEGAIKQNPKFQDITLRKINENDYLGNVRFHIQSPDTVRCKIIKRCLTLSGLKNILHKYYASLDVIIYMHVFQPICHYDVLEYKKEAKCKNDEEIIIVNFGSRINNHVSDLEIVIKLKSKDIIKIFKFDMEIPILYVTSFQYRVLSDERLEYLLIADLKMRDNIRINYYLPDSTLEYLIYISETLFLGDSKFIISKHYDYNLHIICVLSKSEDIAFYTPISHYVLKSYIAWGKKCNPPIEHAGEECQEKFFMRDHGRILLHHFLKFGY